MLGGKEGSTLISSHTRVEAIKEFKEMALGVLVSIEEVNEPLTQKVKNYINKISRTRRETAKKKVKLEPYISSLRQLGVMMGAGIPLTKCFDEVVSTTEDKYLKQILQNIGNKIEAGESIGNAFDTYKYELGNISASMIKLGEQTGALSQEIKKLANIIEEIHNNRKKLKKALRYPMIVMSVMIIAFVVVIQMIVPQFQEMFNELGANLPLPTRILIGLNEFLSNNGFYIIGAIALSIALHTALYKNNEKYHFFIDKFSLKIFLVGKVTKLSMLGRYVFVFNSLSNSGVPIINALNIAENIVENRYLKSKLVKIGASIEEGRSLTEGFIACGEFENMTVQMVKAGEASGTMTQMLEKIDDHYSEKYNDFVDNISTYIEPIMIVVLASFLVILALGIFLPMWSMADALDQSN